jgi:tRNA threonylcarbamoyladenosine biosynthesis protein TsaE
MEVDIAIEKHYKNIGLEDLPTVAEAVFQLGKEYPIWLFNASMGSGKTTFIKSICSYLKVSDHVSSPTFSLVNEYESKQIGIIYHFDFYRIEDEREALDIGVEEYFYSGNLCLIEWPEMIPSFIPDSYLTIKINQSTSGTTRDITIKQHGKGGIS